MSETAGRATGWLIETGAGTYWSGRAPTHFTSDNADACRFGRFEDAERVRCWLIQEANKELASACRSSEHVWITKPPAMSELIKQHRYVDGKDYGKSGPIPTP
jgi:hypothetical protein